VEVAEWIVGQRRQVNHRVKAAKLLDFDVPQVQAYVHACLRLPLVSKGAVLEEKRVEPGHLVSGVVKDARHDRTDVTVVTRHQDTHRSSAEDSGRLSCST